MTDAVRYDVDDGCVAVLTLSRPDRHNMWTAEIETEFYNALDRAADDEHVRAIVATGASDSFVRGLDPALLSDVSRGGKYTRNRRPQTYATTMPVIGAINGSWAGTAFSKRGLSAEDATVWMLIRLTGSAHAETPQLVVVQHVSLPGDVVSDAVAFAHRLAPTVLPVAMAKTKSQLWRDSESSKTARVHAQYLVALAKAQLDFVEGVASLTEKRLLTFSPCSPLPFLGRAWT
jgi:enoyl-CoA hydratase/carnithine racemase